MSRISSLILGLSLLLSFSAFSAIDPLTDAADRQMTKAPIIEKSMHSKNYRTRARAAEALGRILNAESVDPLLSLLKDSDARVVRQAIFSLGQLGWMPEFNGNREKEIVTAISPFLVNASDKTRAETLHAIGKLGYLDTPTLIEKSLNDVSERVREEAIISLFRYRYASSMRALKFEPWTDEFANKVLALSKDSSFRVRRAVAFIFSRYKDIRALSTLLVLIQDKDATTRVHAINGLKPLADLSAVPSLLTALQDSVKEVRLAALEALDGLKAYDRLADVDLVRLQRDPYFAVRKKTTDILGKSVESKNRVTFTAVLEKFSKDSSLMVSAAANAALIRLLRSGTPTAAETARVDALIAALLKSPVWQYRQVSVSALSSAMGEIYDEKSATPTQLKAMSTLLHVARSDSHLVVRTAAQTKFFLLPGETGLEITKLAMFSSELSERGGALMVFSKRKETDQEKVDLLMEYYRASLDPKLEEARGWAIDVLGEIKSDLATEALKTTLKDQSPLLVGMATKELRARGITLPDAPAAPLTFTPHRDLRFKRNPLVIFHTNRGRIVMEGFARLAPVHVANFVGLARSGFYVGKSFQRVASNFVVQGGATDLNGYSMDTFSMRAEVNRARYLRGMIGMPRSSSFDTGGSQIFINQITSPWLDGLYTIFARVISGMDVVDRTEIADPILKVEVHL